MLTLASWQIFKICLHIWFTGLLSRFSHYSYQSLYSSFQPSSTYWTCWPTQDQSRCRLTAHIQRFPRSMCRLQNSYQFGCPKTPRTKQLCWMLLENSQTNSRQIVNPCKITTHFLPPCPNICSGNFQCYPSQKVSKQKWLPSYTIWIILRRETQNWTF